MLAFTEMTDNGQTLIARDYIYGCLSFFVVSFGGLAIGLIFAFIASYVTKLVIYNSKKKRYFQTNFTRVEVIIYYKKRNYRVKTFI